MTAKSFDTQRTRGMSAAEKLAYWSAPQANGCIQFTGTVDQRNGHGQLHFGRRNRMAHRLAWEIAKGLVPTGKMVFHRCDNPACINVDHLMVGARADLVKLRGTDLKRSRRRHIRQIETAESRLDYYSMPEPNSGCLLWLGTTGRSGQPTLSMQGADGRRTRAATRLVFEIERGPIPAGHRIHQRCGVKCCVNASHLIARPHYAVPA